MAALANMLFTGLGAGLTARSQMAEGRYAAQAAGANARMAELQAEDALRRGDIEAMRQRQATRGLIGSQRAALAAQGIDLTSGSAMELQEDAAALGAQDAETIRANAWREAWGFRAEATNLRTQGHLERAAAATKAGSTLLTGGLSMLRQYADRERPVVGARSTSGATKGVTHGKH